MSILENESDYYSSWPPLDIHWHQRTTVLVHTFQWITRIYTTPTSCFGLRYIHLSHPSDIRFDLRFLLWICRKYSTKNGGLAKDHTFYWIFSAPFPNQEWLKKTITLSRDLILSTDLSIYERSSWLIIALTFKNGRQKNRRLFVAEDMPRPQCELRATSSESCERASNMEENVHSQWSGGARKMWNPHARKIRGSHLLLTAAVLLFPLVSPENCETGSKCT